MDLVELKPTAARFATREIELKYSEVTLNSHRNFNLNAPGCIFRPVLKRSKIELLAAVTSEKSLEEKTIGESIFEPIRKISILKKTLKI